MGAPVRWTGAPTDRDILDERRRRQGRRLEYGHPGRLTSIAMPHVQIDWLGLEAEPISFGVGFGPDSAGRYLRLELLSEEEWSSLLQDQYWQAVIAQEKLLQA